MSWKAALLLPVAIATLAAVPWRPGFYAGGSGDDLAIILRIRSDDGASTLTISYTSATDPVVHSETYNIVNDGNEFALRQQDRKCGGIVIAKHGELLQINYGDNAIRLGPTDAATATALEKGVAEAAAQYKALHMHVASSAAILHYDALLPNCQ